jgi:hypothetical protein
MVRLGKKTKDGDIVRMGEMPMPKSTPALASSVSAEAEE